jgi:hypothetical protein
LRCPECGFENIKYFFGTVWTVNIKKDKKVCVKNCGIMIPNNKSMVFGRALTILQLALLLEDSDLDDFLHNTLGVSYFASVTRMVTGTFLMWTVTPPVSNATVTG